MTMLTPVADPDTVSPQGYETTEQVQVSEAMVLGEIEGIEQRKLGYHSTSQGTVPALRLTGLLLTIVLLSGFTVSS